MSILEILLSRSIAMLFVLMLFHIGTNNSSFLGAIEHNPILYAEYPGEFKPLVTLTRFLITLVVFARILKAPSYNKTVFHGFALAQALVTLGLYKQSFSLVSMLIEVLPVTALSGYMVYEELDGWTLREETMWDDRDGESISYQDDVNVENTERKSYDSPLSARAKSSTKASRAKRSTVLRAEELSGFRGSSPKMAHKTSPKIQEVKQQQAQLMKQRAAERIKQLRKRRKA